MRIRVGVDAARSRLGRLTMSNASGTSGPVDACATADPAAARGAGNAAHDPLRPGGHAPFGAYTLKEVRPVAGASTRELGEKTLVFEPRSGEARHAESLGRLVLMLHAGQAGDDGRLRTTSLGLRVWPDTLARIVAAAARGEGIDLEIYDAPLTLWDRIFFCRRRPSRGFGDATTRDRDDDDWRSSSSSSGGSSTSRGETFSGKGGQSGGAGASGSWDAGATGTAMAAGAALGAGIAAAGESEASSDSGSSSTDDGGTSGSEGSTSY